MTDDEFDVQFDVDGFRHVLSAAGNSHLALEGFVMKIHGIASTLYAKGDRENARALVSALRSEEVAFGRLKSIAYFWDKLKHLDVVRPPDRQPKQQPEQRDIAFVQLAEAAMEAARHALADMAIHTMDNRNKRDLAYQAIDLAMKRLPSKKAA